MMRWKWKFVPQSVIHKVESPEEHNQVNLGSLVCKLTSLVLTESVTPRTSQHLKLQSYRVWLDSARMTCEEFRQDLCNASGVLSRTQSKPSK